MCCSLFSDLFPTFFCFYVSFIFYICEYFLLHVHYLHLLLTLQGLLDLLANRCLAQGTNAWTATDHTAYTMETAGSEGFLNLLPIYLDHVLYPTLTVSNLQCNENVFLLYPLDQFMFLGNFPHTCTPSLSQHFALSEN